MLFRSSFFKFYAPAPVVHYDWKKLVNTFSDENSFVRLGRKETEIRQKAKDYYAKGNIYVMPQNPEHKYEVWKDSGLLADVKIIEISRLGATIVNRLDWQVGEEHEINLKFDEINATVKCEVVKVRGNLAQVKFKNLPQSVANKITYRYMKMAANNQ